METFILVGVFAGSAQAGQEADAWTKVHAHWPGNHGYYKLSPNGVVLEKWSCNANWKDCDGNAQYFPVSKFEEPPFDTPCDASIGLRKWIGTDEFLDDEGDVSDFLTFGETYWFCDTHGQDVFRSSE